MITIRSADIALDNGTTNYREDILDFLNSSKVFGSLFVLSSEEGDKRIVCEIKNVNEGQDQISFVSLGEEERFEYVEGESLLTTNEAGNISFNSTVVMIHNKSWLTLNFPTSLRTLNQRGEPRLNLEENHIVGAPTLHYFGEDGVKKLMSHECEILDISSGGFSVKIPGKRLDGYYRDDVVEAMITEKFPYMTKVRGKVVYRSIANMLEEEDRFYRIGIKFDKALNLSSLS